MFGTANGTTGIKRKESTMTFFGLSERESYSKPLQGAELGLFEHIKPRVLLAEGTDMFGGGLILNEEFALVHCALGGKVIDLTTVEGEVIHSIMVHTDEDLGLGIVRFHKRPPPPKFWISAVIPKNKICYVITHELHLDFMLSECEIKKWTSWVKNHQIEPVYEEGVIGCPVYNPMGQLMGMTIGTQEDVLIALDVNCVSQYAIQFAK